MGESLTDAGGLGASSTPARNASIYTKAIQSEPVIPSEVSYYDMSKNKYLIIFNHYKFKNTKYFKNRCPTTRLGTYEDVKSLQKVFVPMGYKITCHDDLEYSQIFDEILRISQQNHKETSCLCIVFLTHGWKGGEIYAADRPYPFRDVTALLENGHDSLVGKPKIFFVQACRGDQIDSGRRVEIDGSEVSLVIPTHADFLVLYSTVEDFVSYRDREGSFMIQELCDVIEEYHKDMDILHIITLMQRRVAYFRTTNAPSKLSVHDKKQMPETRFSLTQLFKF